MKRKSNGFTLIELLAVIVILGIIITIIVTNVVKYIGKAREGAFKDTYSKVLRDVKNKIALKNLGYTTEEVVCSDYSECASLYDVSTNDVNLIVTKVLENYIVNMEGKGSYASISMKKSTCPKNSYCSTNSIFSNISSNGEEKEINIESLLVLNVKNNTPINCSGKACSKYGEKITEIISSTGGYAVTKGENIIIYDKNGNNFSVEKQGDAQKYKNLISLTKSADKKTSNTKGYLKCGDNTAIYVKSDSNNKAIYKDDINYNKNLVNEKYYYAYYNGNNRTYVFYCDDNTKPIVPETNYYINNFDESED